MNIGICEWNIPLKGTAKRFEWAAKAGLAAVEIDLEHIDDMTRVAELRDLWNLQTPTLGINYCCGHGMIDPHETEGIRATFRAAVHTAAQLNIAKLQVPSFGASYIETRADVDRTVEHYQYLCGLAEDAGLLVGTENALDAERQLELLERVDSPALKIYFDTRNAFSMRGLDSAAILDQLYPHLCEVHLKDGLGDGPSRALGDGDSGFFECLAILKARGFDGWMLLENDYATIEQCRADIDTVQKEWIS